MVKPPPPLPLETEALNCRQLRIVIKALQGDIKKTLEKSNVLQAELDGCPPYPGLGLSRVTQTELRKVACGGTYSTTFRATHAQEVCDVLTALQRTTHIGEKRIKALEGGRAVLHKERTDFSLEVTELQERIADLDVELKLGAAEKAGAKCVAEEATAQSRAAQREYEIVKDELTCALDVIKGLAEENKVLKGVHPPDDTHFIEGTRIGEGTRVVLANIAAGGKHYLYKYHAKDVLDVLDVLGKCHQEINRLKASKSFSTGTNEILRKERDALLVELDQRPLKVDFEVAQGHVKKARGREAEAVRREGATAERLATSEKRLARLQKALLDDVFAKHLDVSTGLGEVAQS